MVPKAPRREEIRKEGLAMPISILTEIDTISFQKLVLQNLTPKIQYSFVIGKGEQMRIIKGRFVRLSREDGKLVFSSASVYYVFPRSHEERVARFPFYFLRDSEIDGITAKATTAPMIYEYLWQHTQLDKKNN